VKKLNAAVALGDTRIFWSQNGWLTVIL